MDEFGLAEIIKAKQSKRKNNQFSTHPREISFLIIIEMRILLR
jgi:hypothetical protein